MRKKIEEKRLRKRLRTYMDAAPESSVISSFLDSDRFSRSEQVPPSFEGLVAQIVAAKPNKETVC